MDAGVWLPEAGSGPGLVLVQEVLGVSDWIAAAAAQFAAEGYVVAAPDVYWRIQRGFVGTHDDAGLAAALEIVAALDLPLAVQDVVAALAALGDRDEVGGTPGVIGYCFGGTLSWMAAAAGDPRACVSYYGTGLPDALDQVDEITCPTLLHFGTTDPFLPPEVVDRIRGAIAGKDHIEMHVHEGAGHAFENDLGPFYDPEATARARAMTLEFLARFVGARPENGRAPRSGG